LREGVIKAIIFDLDNTLVDFMRMKEVSIEAAVDGMIDAGLSMDKEGAKKKIFEIYEEKGIEYQNVFDQFLKDAFGAIDYKLMSAGIVAYRRAREAALVLYPHVNYTLVELLKRGLKLAVITDAPRREAWLRLCYLNLHQVFDYVLTFEDTGELKPGPAPFRKALGLLGIRPEEALMIGDWPERDMVGASKVGIRTVIARYGDTSGVEDPGSDYIIDDIIELMSLVEEINLMEEDGS
jgi:putative hydrolase of the HAD superfamily